MKSAWLLCVCLLMTAALRTTSSAQPEEIIAFGSNRDNPTGNRMLASEIYLMRADGSDATRLTDNTFADAFPAQSPDGMQIIFDSNRKRIEAEALNTSDLFIMKIDGSGQAFVTRGSSPTWSPDGKRIAFHRSASGAGKPTRLDPGAATTDSDIFVMDMSTRRPVNITKSADAIEDDADWSPTSDVIVYTSHRVDDDQANSVTAEIYVRNADGTGAPKRLTDNAEEERSPSWSSDGSRIVFACRRGGRDFEICVMNADGSKQKQLTDNALPDLSPVWSPDDGRIAFERRTGDRLQLWTMNADGTTPTQLTQPPGDSVYPNWAIRQ
jgi:TolB protein